MFLIWLSWDVELTSEEEEAFIRKIADKMHGYGMDVPTILLLEAIKPLNYIGSQLGRFFVSPFLLFLGEDISSTGEKLFQVFDKRENIEKIVIRIEELSNEEKRAKLENKREQLKQE
jgi:hypothetical protein